MDLLHLKDSGIGWYQRVKPEEHLEYVFTLRLLQVNLDWLIPPNEAQLHRWAQIF